MPLIRLKPHKARVVIEDGVEMILVLMVSLNRGESVELASGGRLETMKGMLRIRERGGLLTRADGKTNGRLTFVPETSVRQQAAARRSSRSTFRSVRASFACCSISVAPGRLPHKIFMQAGERTMAGPRGVTYRAKDGRTGKFWDNVAHRRVPVTSLTFVVPVDVANAGGPAARNARATTMTSTTRTTTRACPRPRDRSHRRRRLPSSRTSSSCSRARRGIC